MILSDFLPGVFSAPIALDSDPVNFGPIYIGDCFCSAIMVIVDYECVSLLWKHIDTLDFSMLLKRISQRIFRNGSCHIANIDCSVTI